MEKILINWLETYTNTYITKQTKFSNLNFDLLDQTLTMEFVKKEFNKNINIKGWFETVEDLIKFILT